MKGIQDPRGVAKAVEAVGRISRPSASLIAMVAALYLFTDIYRDHPGAWMQHPMQLLVGAIVLVAVLTGLWRRD